MRDCKCEMCSEHKQFTIKSPRCENCCYWNNPENLSVGFCEVDDEPSGQSDHCKGYLSKDGTR